MDSDGEISPFSGKEPVDRRLVTRCCGGESLGGEGVQDRDRVAAAAAVVSWPFLSAGITSPAAESSVPRGQGTRSGSGSGSAGM